MRVSATSEVVRIMGVWVRRADAGLARSAARNAAHSVKAEEARRLEYARALRDLQGLGDLTSLEREAARLSR